MSIEGLSTRTHNTPIQTPGNVNTPPVRPVRRDNDGDDENSRRPQEHSGAHKLSGAVVETLKSLGLTVPAQNKQKAAETDGDSKPQDNPGKSGDVQQALHTFMHTLYQALGPQGNKSGATPPDSKENDDRANDSAPPPPPGRQAYAGDLGSKIQNLVQGLSSGDSKGTGAADNLKSAFNNLVQTLQKSDESAPKAENQHPDLQTFLQNFAKTVQANGAAVSPLGGTVNTQV